MSSHELWSTNVNYLFPSLRLLSIAPALIFTKWWFCKFAVFLGPPPAFFFKVFENLNQWLALTYKILLQIWRYCKCQSTEHLVIQKLNKTENWLHAVKKFNTNWWQFQVYRSKNWWNLQRKISNMAMEPM
jgi:hypothetical protein